MLFAAVLKIVLKEYFERLCLMAKPFLLEPFLHTFRVNIQAQ